MDTVFDEGTVAQRRPYRVDGDRALDQGTSDMKGGLLPGCTRWPPSSRPASVRR